MNKLEAEKPLRTLSILSGSGKKFYTVCRYETFDTCTCPSFKFRRTCKHIKKLNLFTK